MGGPDATPNLWKQLFSAVRASGGYPGNDYAITTESRKNAAQSITIRNIILLFIIKPLRPRPNAASLG